MAAPCCHSVDANGRRKAVWQRLRLFSRPRSRSHSWPSVTSRSWRGGHPRLIVARHWSRVIGSFPKDAVIVRLVSDKMLGQNGEWSLNRRYMQLVGLQAVSNTAPTRLPAVAR
jgi:hypothetical protein